MNTMNFLIGAYIVSLFVVPVILPFWVNSKRFRLRPFTKKRFSIRLPFVSVQTTGLTLSRLGSYFIVYALLSSFPFFPSWAAFAITLVIVSQTSDWLQFRQEKPDSPYVESP